MIGAWVVNVTVFLIITVLSCVLFVVLVPMGLSTVVEIIVVFLLPVAVGWLWWSMALPRWRVWALERVDDPGALLIQAIERKLMWPPGHFFERTEIRSSRLREREKAVGWIPYHEKNR